MYGELITMKKGSILEYEVGGAHASLCPDMGGRVFVCLGGICPHRIDMETVANPVQEFNNFGGGNFWPAPEGGMFGFNYDGDTWLVQQAINNQPFDVVHQDSGSALIAKNITLINRAGTTVDATMNRRFRLECDIDPVLSGYTVKKFLTYVTEDSFDVLNSVPVESALISSWTLEQFAASDDTISFCSVQSPDKAINFDFYDHHPGDRIQYLPKGFIYKTDGTCMGQIGIKKEAKADLIGFYDLSNNMVCIRRNLGGYDGVYFNIADNDQPNGPYSAADNYSIYNSDPEMRAFELETVGSARVENGLLKGSDLVSRTTLALFESGEDIKAFIEELLGSSE